MELTVRSTIQPEPIRLWRMEVTEEGLLLHLSLHWDEHQVEVEGIDEESHQEWEYKEARLVILYKGLVSEVANWLTKNQTSLVLRAKAKWEEEHDAPTLSLEERESLIDYETGHTINTRLHPTSGVEEQIGILRKQLVNLLDGLGITPTAEFEAMNAIVLEEVENGRAKKGS